MKIRSGFVSNSSSSSFMVCISEDLDLNKINDKKLKKSFQLLIKNREVWVCENSDEYYCLDEFFTKNPNYILGEVFDCSSEDGCIKLINEITINYLSNSEKSLQNFKYDDDDDDDDDDDE